MVPNPSCFFTKHLLKVPTEIDNELYSKLTSFIIDFKLKLPKDYQNEIKIKPGLTTYVELTLD